MSAIDLYTWAGSSLAGAKWTRHTGDTAAIDGGWGLTRCEKHGGASDCCRLAGVDIAALTAAERCPVCAAYELRTAARLRSRANKSMTDVGNIATYTCTTARGEKSATVTVEDILTITSAMLPTPLAREADRLAE